MKRYLIVLLMFGLIGALTFCVAGPARAYEKPKEKSAPGEDKEEEEKAEDEDEEAEQREIERLRKAWKRHKEEEKEENPREASSEQQNPFESIINKQKAVERRLAREDAGPTTQEKIREIRDLLNDLIKQAEEAQQQQQQQQQQEEQQKKEKQKQQEKPQPQPQQQRQLNDPSRMNPAQPNTQRQKQILKKLKNAEKYRLKYRAKGGSLEQRWGSLPGEVREDAEAGSREEFPEKYRELLENYYKQLGKRQPGR